MPEISILYNNNRIRKVALPDSERVEGKELNNKLRIGGSRRFQDLYFCFCGYEKCEPRHHFGPAVRSNYLVHFILSGKGRYVRDGQTRQLGEGEGFLIEPGRQTYYEADGQDPWEYIWVGFDGTMAKPLMEQMGLTGENMTFRSSHKDELQAIVREMLQLDASSDANEILQVSLLYRFIAYMSMDAVPLMGEKTHGNAYVRKAMEYIQYNYAAHIQVEDIAAYININRSYLYSLFIREIGMSPKEYLVTCRLTRAAEMLDYTRLTVESIAISCGYRDPAVFTKAFRKKFGLSPIRYRQRTERYARESTITDILPETPPAEDPT